MSLSDKIVSWKMNILQKYRLILTSLIHLCVICLFLSLNKRVNFQHWSCNHWNIMLITMKYYYCLILLLLYFIIIYFLNYYYYIMIITMSILVRKVKHKLIIPPPSKKSQHKIRQILNCINIDHVFPLH